MRSWTTTDLSYNVTVFKEHTYLYILKSPTYTYKHEQLHYNRAFYNDNSKMEE